ncbi:MAG: helix-turn-helix domain-containing protein [Oscillospiraceae bacterium]
MRVDKSMVDILHSNSKLSGVSMIKGPDNTKLLLQQQDGHGQLVFYPLFSGITLAYNHIQSPTWPESEFEDAAAPFKINYCISGRCELLLNSNSYVYVKEGELALSNQVTQKQYIYPTKQYEGIELYIDVAAAQKNMPWLKKEFGIDLAQMVLNYCGDEKTYIAEATIKVEAILKKLWNMADAGTAAQMKLGVVELLCLLAAQKDFSQPSSRTFYTETQVEIAKKAEQILTADISKHHPIRCLAQQFAVSESSIKNYFRGVYGQNISDYLRNYRVTIAKQMLAETERPISEISVMLGYTNQGKFAAIFKSVVGRSPLDYRRTVRLAKIQH